MRGILNVFVFPAFFLRMRKTDFILLLILIITSKLILKAFTSGDRKLIIQTFITLVRFILKYASCMWSLLFENNIHIIEPLQRGFAKQLLGFKNLSYDDRLANVDITRFEH